MSDALISAFMGTYSPINDGGQSPIGSAVDTGNAMPYLAQPLSIAPKGGLSPVGISSNSNGGLSSNGSPQLTIAPSNRAPTGTQGSKGSF